MRDARALRAPFDVGRDSGKFSACALRVSGGSLLRTPGFVRAKHKPTTVRTRVGFFSFTVRVCR